MSRKRTISLFLCSLPILWGCKDVYVSPYKSPPTGYLVVEGYISGNTTTQFTLSRSIELPGDSTIPAENGAQVQVEGSDNTAYPLIAQSNGVYSSGDTLRLNPAVQYRLSIHTSNGEDYRSDYVAFKTTPAIDSISWVNSGSGVEIYANTHDPANNTHYYQWNWDQTYEYHSFEESYYYWDNNQAPPGIVPRPQADQVFRCWMSSSSTNLLLGNSTKLAQDVIYAMPLKNIPPDDVQLSVLYTILVRQYSLTEDGYNFLSLMQKNSESLGSIFDAQPSQIVGNIHCETHPAEQVIGFVSAGTVQQQRIYISRAQVPSSYSFRCPIPDTVLGNDPKSLMVNFASLNFTPVFMIGTPAGTEWDANYTTCLNCTLVGGTNVAPSYWPN